MNAKEALDIRKRFLELKELVKKGVPKEKEMTHPWNNQLTVTYELTHIVLEDLAAHYRTYMGCGDYEYLTEHIDLYDLFKEQV